MPSCISSIHCQKGLPEISFLASADLPSCEMSMEQLY